MSGAGRVVTRVQAKERGLVDQLGGLDTAVKSAAARSLGDDFDRIHRARAARLDAICRCSSASSVLHCVTTLAGTGWRGRCSTRLRRTPRNSSAAANEGSIRRGRCRTASATCAELIARKASLAALFGPCGTAVNPEDVRACGHLDSMYSRPGSSPRANAQITSRDGFHQPIAGPRSPEHAVQILQTLAAMLEDPKARRSPRRARCTTGVSEAALYRHFASKAQMFEA